MYTYIVTACPNIDHDTDHGHNHDTDRTLPYNKILSHCDQMRPRPRPRPSRHVTSHPNQFITPNDKRLLILDLIPVIPDAKQHIDPSTGIQRACRPAPANPPPPATPHHPTLSRSRITMRSGAHATARTHTHPPAAATAIRHTRRPQTTLGMARRSRGPPIDSLDCSRPC